MNILVDLDGVHVDFCGQACKEFGHIHDERLPDAKEYFIEKRLGISPDTLWARIRHKQPCWWYNLPEYEWSKDLHKLVLEFTNKYWVCSSHGYMPNAAKGKVSWVNAHLDMPVVLTRDKWLLAKPGTVLIDDTEEQVNQFREAGGGAVLFPQPWNQAWSPDYINNPQVRLAYVRNCLTELHKEHK